MVHRPAGARRRDGDVQRDDRGARDGIASSPPAPPRPRSPRRWCARWPGNDAYLQRGQADRSANTTPGNKKGGLSNIVEKAMGSIVKERQRADRRASSPASGCATAASAGGLVYAATPASDFICGTLQLAAGMNLRLHHRPRHALRPGPGAGDQGRHAQRARAPLARPDGRQRRPHRRRRREHPGTWAGNSSAWMLDVASGRLQTFAEQWKLANALVLFNPAPVT